MIDGVPGVGRGSPARALRGAALAAAVFLAWACGDGFFVDPAEHPPLRISIQPTLDVAGAAFRDGLDDAFDRADQARVILRVVGESAVVFDEVVGFDASGGDGIVDPVVVELQGVDDDLLLELELLAGGAVVFRTEQRISLARGQPTDIEVTVTPVASAVETTPPSVTLDAIGATAQLSARVVLATGDAWEGRPIQWTVRNPAVASVTAGGLLTAEGEGQTVAEARSGDVVGTVAVTVAATVATVEVDPEEAAVGLGESVAFTARALDLDGTPLARVFQWSSTNPDVATVDQDGVATGVGPGEALIEATAGGVTGSARLRVAAEPPAVTTLLAQDVSASAVTLRGLVNPRGLETTGFFEWGTGPDVNDFTATEPVALGSGEGDVDLSARLTGLVPGQSYYFRAVAENAAGRTEGQVLTVRTDIADLVVTSLVVIPAAPSTDDEVSVVATVANVGGATAGASVVRLDLGSDAASFDVEPLASGQSTDVEWSIGTLDAAAYLVTAIADATDRVEEGDEQNNQRDLEFVVQPVPRPDLTVTDLVIEPANPTSDDAVTFTAVVENVGTAAAGPSQVQFTLPALGLAPTFAVDDLAPGGVQRVPWTLEALEAGAYDVTATADPSDAIEESDENNNTLQTSVEIAAAPRPDLVVAGIAVVPTQPTTDQQVTVTVTVANRGNEVATPSVLFVEIPELEFVARPVVDDLAPGGSQPVELPLGVLSQGSYTVRATADETNDVQESNEANNTLQTSFGVGLPPLADLVITGFSFLPQTPDAGDPIVVGLQIANTGSVASPPTTVDFLLNGSPISSLQLTVLGPGLAVAISDVVIGPFAAGTYTLGLLVDPTNQVPESNKQNNIAEVPLTVAPLNRVSGVVTVEGQPRGGLTVQADGPDTETGVTDEGGVYDIANLSAGTYTVSVVAGANDATFPEQQVQLSGGETAQVDLDGAYIRTASISGTVTLSGSPFPGAQIGLVGPDGSSGVVTDAQGFYSASGLRAGTYTVTVTNPPAGATFAPSASQQIALAVGQAASVSFVGTFPPLISGIGFTTSFPENVDLTCDEGFPVERAISASYSDPDGNMTPVGEFLEGRASLLPAGSSFPAYFTGDGFNGVAWTGICYQSEPTEAEIFDVSFFDANGNQSNTLQVTIPPAGGAPPRVEGQGPPAPARAASPRPRTGNDPR